MKYNILEIKRYLNFFSSSTNKIFTFSLLDLEAKKPTRNMGTFFESMEPTGHSKGISVRLSELTDKEWTLHMCLNETSDKGRKKKDIQRVQVLCVDIDDYTTDTVIKTLIEIYHVQMVVSSSLDSETDKAKYHLYWKLDQTITLEVWSKLQCAFAWRMNGDLQLGDITKNIRVPGVERKQKTGALYTPEIVFEKPDSTPWSLVDIEHHFPWVWDAWHEYEIDHRKTLKIERKVFESIKKVNGEFFIDEDEIINLSSKAGRNRTLFVTLQDAIKRRKIGTFDELLTLAEKVDSIFMEKNSKGGDKNDEYGLLKTAESAWERTSVLPHQNGLMLNGHDVDMDIQKISAEEFNNKLIGLPKLEVLEFDYDYSTPALKENRFTEESLTEKAFQRFNKDMCWVDKEFYAFDHSEKLWIHQTYTKRTQLHTYASKIMKDTRNDPKFLDFGYGKDGEFIPAKLSKAQEKFASFRVKDGIVKDLFQSDRVLKKRSDEFDSNENLLFIENGVLNLFTGEIREAHQEDFLLSRSEVLYDKHAQCPQWIKFLNQVFREQQDLINFIQELFGYSLSGSVSEQKIFCHYGSGANGKSKVLSALYRLCGDYGTYVDPDVLTVTRGSINPKSFERLGSKIEGKRLVLIDDIDTNTIWNESFVKNVTATRVRARAEYEQSREVVNRAKLHLGLNVAPTPQAENLGILRRLCIIPYLETFQANAADSDRIDGFIRDEMSGILNWARAGFVRIQENEGRITYPNATELAIEEYKSEHFVIEEVVTSLYQKSDSEGDFEFLSAITQDIESYLLQNNTPKKVSSDEISRCFRTLFGISSERKWDTERKNNFRGFKVKLKVERTKNSNFII